MTHWAFNVGLTNCFENSIPYNLWGVNCKMNRNAIHFRKYAQTGDTIWFVKPKTKGRDKTRLEAKIFAFATYSHCKMRDSLSPTNEQLGWGKDGGWNTEIHYTDFKIIHNIPHKLYSCNPRRIPPVEELVEELVEEPVENYLENLQRLSEVC